MANELCRACATVRIEALRDFGPQPPSNRFVTATSKDDDVHPLVLGQCPGCGLLQLIDPMQPDMVRSRFGWLTYNEPEGHLDHLVARLCEMLPDSGEARVLGITYKDDSTLARFQERGCGPVGRLDPAADLGMREPNSGLETLQGALNARLGTELARRHGQADLVLARHLLEHADRPQQLLGCLLELTKPGGHVVFEVPDSAKFVRSGDYCFLWEEHVTYFSELTLIAFLREQDAELVALWRYPYAAEDSLIAVVRRRVAGIGAGANPRVLLLDAELELARCFAERFDSVRRAYRDYLSGLRDQGKRIAAFGAGHLATKFINLFDLGDSLECVIDDNPHKEGLCMPGSRLPIVGSAVLYSEKIDLCLLSLSPESEAKVLAKRQDYVDAGGVFRSMFSLSPLALWHDIENQAGSR